MLVSNQSKDKKGTRTSFLTNGSEQIALNWAFRIALFFKISFTSNFTNSFLSRITIGWEGIFDWKGFEWNGILYPFTMSNILGSCAIFIQAPIKCFNLPANGMCGILFDKNNFFINGCTFLDSFFLVKKNQLTKNLKPSLLVEIFRFPLFFFLIK